MDCEYLGQMEKSSHGQGLHQWIGIDCGRILLDEPIQNTSDVIILDQENMLKTKYVYKACLAKIL